MSKKTANFLYVPQHKKTLAGPYIVCTRGPICILEMQLPEGYIYKGHKGVVFLSIHGHAMLTDEARDELERRANEWWFSQLSAGTIAP